MFPKQYFVNLIKFNFCFGNIFNLCLALLEWSSSDPRLFVPLQLTQKAKNVPRGKIFSVNPFNFYGTHSLSTGALHFAFYSSS